MSFYTQFRGVLCCQSVGHPKRDIAADLFLLKKTFVKKGGIPYTLVCKDTHFHKGCNDTGWIFIGTEFQSPSVMVKWIKFLTENILCEGRIEEQNENIEIGDKASVYLISVIDGKSVIKEEKYTAHTCGYGFDGENDVQ